MDSKLTAVPILALVISLSTMGLVNAESNDTTGITSETTTNTLHVGYGNGNFFDLPYSISGATVTGVKADTSIPKMTISISPTQDGQITLQVPGGDKDSTQQNLAVLVDGQASQYTQSFDNGHRTITISFHATSSTIDIVGQNLPPHGDGTMQPGQTSASCTQDDIAAAKQGLADIQKKMADLRTQYYNDWQTAHNSGQYSGTFEQYSREKISNSADASQIKSDYQKYNSILRSCHAAGHMKPYAPSSTTCSQSDITNARQELATTQKQGYDLKNKAYQQFQQDQSSGQYKGTWEQYAKEKFLNLPEVKQLKSTHDKYTSFLKSCFGKQARSQGAVPQNPDDNSMPPLSPPNTNNPDSSSSPHDNLNTFGSDLGPIGNSNGLPPIDQSQNPIPAISSPTDALGTISSHNIPGWVKGVAGWWAQGKISDDDFVSAIKFLVQQGIIKI